MMLLMYMSWGKLWKDSLSKTFHCSNWIRWPINHIYRWSSLYTDDLKHHLQATGEGCDVGGAWVNSLSYTDDMVLLAPTVKTLQTLLEECVAYAAPHDILHNTTKSVCMLVRPKESQGGYLIRVRLGNEELSFVEEFRYLGHVMTADCRDDKDIKK